MNLAYEITQLDTMQIEAASAELDANEQAIKILSFFNVRSDHAGTLIMDNYTQRIFHMNRRELNVYSQLPDGSIRHIDEYALLNVATIGPHAKKLYLNKEHFILVRTANIATGQQVYIVLDTRRESLSRLSKPNDHR